MKTAVGGLWPNQENPEEQKRREGSRAGRGSLFGSPRPQPSTAWRQDPTRSHRLHLAPTRAQRGLSPTLPPARERGSREALEGLSPEAPSCAPRGGLNFCPHSAQLAEGERPPARLGAEDDACPPESEPLHPSQPGPAGQRTGRGLSTREPACRVYKGSPSLRYTGNNIRPTESQKIKESAHTKGRR